MKAQIIIRSREERGVSFKTLKEANAFCKGLEFGGFDFDKPERGKQEGWIVCFSKPSGSKEVKNNWSIHTE